MAWSMPPLPSKPLKSESYDAFSKHQPDVQPDDLSTAPCFPQPLAQGSVNLVENPSVEPLSMSQAEFELLSPTQQQASRLKGEASALDPWISMIRPIRRMCWRLVPFAVALMLASLSICGSNWVSHPIGNARSSLEFGQTPSTHHLCVRVQVECWQ